MARYLGVASTILLLSIPLSACGVHPHPISALPPSSLVAHSPSPSPSASSDSTGSTTAVSSASTSHGRTATTRWHISSINFNSSQDGVVAASDAQRAAIFRTIDGGSHWSQVGSWPLVDVSHRPTTLEQLGAPLALSFYNSNDGLAEWYQAAQASQMWVDIGRTINGGRTWTLVAKHLAVSDGPNTLVMTASRSAWLVNGAMAGPLVFTLHTIDGGQHWTRRQDPLPTHTVGTAGVDLHRQRNGNTVLMTSLQGISRQTNVIVDQSANNSNKTWHTRKIPVTGLPRFLIEHRGLSDAYWSPSSQWVLAEASGAGPIRIFSYSAAHRRWAPLTTPAQPAQIVLTGANVGFFTDGSRIWKTTNGGNSWQLLPPL